MIRYIRDPLMMLLLLAMMFLQLPFSRLTDLQRKYEGLDCTNGSHEQGCYQCEEDEFTCGCVRKRICNKRNGCINITLARENGFIHCPNEGRKPFESYDSNSYFECLDKRLRISSNQVCDGVVDCFDMSDECLCDIYFDARMCTSHFEANNSKCFETQRLAAFRSTLFIRATHSPVRIMGCSSKYVSTQAKPCDGRPECGDYSDECHCNNPPAFCNDSCHSFTKMGIRYCDGFEDPAWIHINDSACPQGFDERSCPKRFKCNVSGNVSIDVLQVCDGNSDCDDNSDENNCSVEYHGGLFSSDTEMISNPGIRSFFWIIGFIVSLGNAYVIVTTAAFLKNQRVLNSLAFQHVIILNISIADFLMGVYLITIAAYSANFSGIYGSVDDEWRSSLRCSFIGSLLVLSSEASCFFMVVLTGFRLMIVYVPTKSLSSSLLPWKICVAAAWLLSILLSIVPMLEGTSSYFVHGISFPSRFYENGTVDAKFKQFMCRYAILSNTTVKDYGSELKTVEMFIKNHLPESEPVRRFGYYSETSVCMPRFYVERGDPSWEFTTALITVNFLCFIFIAVSYVLIFRRSTESAAKLHSNRSDQQLATMQKRIARIIATDLCCWIPICIMAYVRLDNDFSDIAFLITAVFLLPINSALNPFLFSSVPDALINYCGSKRKLINLEQTSNKSRNTTLSNMQSKV